MICDECCLHTEQDGGLWEVLWVMLVGGGEVAGSGYGEGVGSGGGWRMGEQSGEIFCRYFSC